MNKLVLSLWAWTVAFTALASGPLRHLRLQQANGTILHVSAPTDAHSAACCPSSFAPERSMRALYATSADGLGVYGERSKGVLNSIGEHRIPVIMVEFADVGFQPTTTAELVQQHLGGDQFKLNGKSRGSVRDYFRDQSYGAFLPKFEVVARIKTKRERAYYAARSGNTADVRIGELYKEAVDSAVQQGVNFSNFVEDKGVPLVVLFHAGAGEHDSFETGRDNYPWAHFREWNIKSGNINFKSYFIGSELMHSYATETVVVDGKKVTQYKKDANGNPIVASSELEPIGVFCHEMGHALGLPDLYCTDVSRSTQTPDYHDVMDYGQYGNDGYRPFGYSAYERNYMGWLKFEELTEPTLSTLAPLSASAVEVPRAYLIRNPQNTSEYFTLENRQESDWFTKRLGEGLLIYHIDYDRNAWSGNVVNNNAARLRVTVVPADNAWQGKDDQDLFPKFQGDFFPGTQNVTVFSAESTPKMAWATEAPVRPIYNIRRLENGHIEFAFLDQTLTALHTASAQASDDVDVPLVGLDGRIYAPATAPAGIYLKNGRKIILR